MLERQTAHKRQRTLFGNDLAQYTRYKLLLALFCVLKDAASVDRCIFTITKIIGVLWAAAQQQPTERALQAAISRQYCLGVE